MLQIAINNSIGGGTGLPGSGGGGGGFTNTYSLDFDGVDDYVSTNSKIIASDITLSGWVNFNGSYSAFSAHFPMSITPSNTGVINETLGRFYKDGSTLQIAIQCNDDTGGNFSTYFVDSTTLEGAGWQHICLTYNVTTGHIYAYLNGVAQNWVKIFAASTPVPFLTAVTGRVYESDLTIGRYNPQYSPFTFLGLVDEVSTYNRILTPTEITSISAAPTDLTDLSPIAWYRNGDNGAWKSPQWLIPNNENKDKVSNYSLDFDGVDDYIDVSTISLGTTQSLSWWVYRNSSSTQECPIGSSTSALATMLVYMNGLTLYYKVGGNSLAWVGALSAALTDQKWCNIIITRNGASAKLYLNSTFVSEQTLTGGDITAPVQVDRIGSGTNLAYNYYLNGKMDELALFTSELSQEQVTAIYNGGTPTTISGAVAHYKMGEEATFSGGVWTVPDAVGSNNGTSANMTIEDRVGEAPNSTNNALSFNMDEVDRVTDVPT